MVKKLYHFIVHGLGEFHTIKMVYMDIEKTFHKTGCFINFIQNIPSCAGTLKGDVIDTCTLFK